ncbi:MAG: MFS transporter [Pseudonocardiaceae bacterium]|nr:MFS transporter [Pseudonocardiaceae bacterium]
MRKPSAWTVAAASFAGTTVEYYDFFIYGTAAALVFPQLFFPADDPFISTLAAFGTFAAGYFARPVGGIVFGHFGDRSGRKTMLIISLVLMGVATVAIGLLPSYDVAGPIAPVLLILLRLVQGFAFGGEWGGAVLMAFEYAPPERRGLFASLPQVGPAAGALLGNAIFLPIAALPEGDLLSWGWRVPFLLSIVLVVLGLVVRLRIAESPEFEEVKKAGKQARVPLWDALRRYPRQVVLVAGSFLGFGAFTAVAFTYMIGYATDEVGISRSTILGAVLISTAVQLVIIPVSGALSDRYGRAVVTMSGAGLSAAGAFLLFALVDTGEFGWILVGYLLVTAGFISLGYGAVFALFAEAFESRVRYSGMSLGFQVANVLGSALGPGIAAVLLRATGTPMSIAGYLAVLMLISFISLAALARLVARAPAGVPAREPLRER